MWQHGYVATPLPVLTDVPQSDASAVCCTPLAGDGTLSASAAADLALRLKSLADPVRLRLLDYMLDQPEQEACTCELAPHVGLSEPTVSHHLKRLESAGLLVRERRGMNVYYRVVPESIHAIARALHVDCC